MREKERKQLNRLLRKFKNNDDFFKLCDLHIKSEMENISSRSDQDLKSDNLVKELIGVASLADRVANAPNLNNMEEEDEEI